MEIVPKVKAVGTIAVLFAILLGVQAALGKLPSDEWAVAIEAGLGPVIAFLAGYAKSDSIDSLRRQLVRLGG